MRPDLVIKTRSLAGSSDLTLFAPIKPGLIPSLESVTYKTRVTRLLRALNMGRSSSQEYALLRPFSDAVERVGKIMSVRVVVVEPMDQVLLSVTFDGARESYIRVLWQKVGALLDVIFCNTVDYVSARDNSFEAWLEWANRVQVDTTFFYGVPGVTTEDVRYLREEERLHRKGPELPATDLAATRQALKSVESIALRDASSKPEYSIEAARQGLQSLAVLYRLADLYVPKLDDGKYLHRAARELLQEFLVIMQTPGLVIPAKDRFDKQLAWLLGAPEPDRRQIPPAPGQPETYEPSDVQGGIVHEYKGISRGCLLLIAFDDAHAATAFLNRVIPMVTTEKTGVPPGGVAINLAFTCEGLRAVGLNESRLAWLPQEFREGMEARASVLGDLRMNHPRRWRLPQHLNRKLPNGEPARVELSAVHVVAQLRAGPANGEGEDSAPAEQRLKASTAALLDKLDGVQLLSVQPLVRNRKAGRTVEHFGFVDGISQPSIDPPDSQPTSYQDQVHLGELLLGYANGADETPDPEDVEDPNDARARLDFLRNGSFLVVRKLKQDVPALRAAVSKASQDTKIPADAILAKMMGRKLDGDPLVKPGSTNDFNYAGDPEGKLCPFQAHIRRANPRRIQLSLSDPPGARTPRLARRGMSYGPQYIDNADTDEKKAINSQERGLVFMAYNASLGEQFEVIQRWIGGGNSTGVLSGHSDPFLGVADNGRQRRMRFENIDPTTGAPRTFSIALDGSDTLLADPQPFVRLEWGAYLFTPSMQTLGELKRIAGTAKELPPWSVQEGRRQIERLQALEGGLDPAAAALAWKSALEDPISQERFISASIYAAIRKDHAGALRTPYGVIVADRDLVMETFSDAKGTNSVRGYRDRMLRSIGEIFLGMDHRKPGDEYEQQSKDVTAEIGKITDQDAFDLTRSLTQQWLKNFLDAAKKLPTPADPSRWDLNIDVKEILDPVLADLCEIWFGLSTTKGYFARGSQRWDWAPPAAPFYPGNFTAPSRYIFQPHPGSTVEDLGQLYGATLTAAARSLVAHHRGANSLPTDPSGNTAPLAKPIFDQFADPKREDLIARTWVGALMGFLPTVDGNVRLALNEWLREGTFWTLRRSMALLGKNPPYAAIAKLLHAPLVRAMQLRPSPDLVWRTAVSHHRIGNVRVEPGDRIVLSIVSATHQCLEQNSADVYAIFGGERGSKGCPVHACPAYGAAMGTLLGFLSALLEVEEAMRASPAPLAFVFEGPI